MIEKILFRYFLNIHTSSKFKYQSNGQTFLPLQQRWIGKVNGVGNRKSRKLELAQMSELGNQNFFSELGKKTSKKGIPTHLCYTGNGVELRKSDH